MSSPAAQKMGVGPSNSGCRIRVQTSGCCFGPMVEVVSETGKARARFCQVTIEETSASEPPMNCRKRREHVKTEGDSLSWDQSERYLFTAQGASGRRGGVTSVQASVGNVGTCIAMPREWFKRKPHKSLSTNARCRDGAVCSSDEGTVSWRSEGTALSRLIGRTTGNERTL